ncbi:MAG TPA: hypothetical protein P5230_03140 [Candidatus Magasanikbacteria bacterium]|nr:hypothetical protein [Candidatus Magasanikbacteria bacterium]
MSKQEEISIKEEEGSKIDDRVDFYVNNPYYDNSYKYEELVGELETYIATLTSKNTDKQAEFNKIYKDKFNYDNPSMLETLNKSFDGWSVEDVQKLLEGIKNSKDKFDASYSQKDKNSKELRAAITANIFLKNKS